MNRRAAGDDGVGLLIMVQRSTRCLGKDEIGREVGRPECTIVSVVAGRLWEKIYEKTLQRRWKDLRKDDCSWNTIAVAPVIKKSKELHTNCIQIYFQNQHQTIVHHVIPKHNAFNT